MSDLHKCTSCDAQIPMNRWMCEECIAGHVPIPRLLRAEDLAPRYPPVQQVGTDIRPRCRVCERVLNRHQDLHCADCE